MADGIHRNFENVPVMWEPEEDSGKIMKRFMKTIEQKYNMQIRDYWDLHKWSVDNVDLFWGELWNLSDVIHSKTYDKVVDLSLPFHEPLNWFAGARLNYAENLLKYRDDHVALIVTGEDRETEKLTYAELYEETKMYAAAMKKLGIRKGDRVSCFMSNRKEAVLAMLGAVSLGAIFLGALPMMGSQAVLNRFKQVEPRILFTVDRFPHEREEKDMLPKLIDIAAGLKSLEKVVIVASKPESKLKDISNIKNSCFLDEFLETGRDPEGNFPEVVFEQVPIDHPVFINYTSGTTGLPKPLIHGSGVLFTMTRDFRLHFNHERDGCWLSMSPVGWASWNIFLNMLFLGATTVIFEGVPYFLSPTYLWDMVDEFKITNLFLTPSTLDDLEKKGYLPSEKNHLNSLSTIMSGGSVVKPQNYDFVYKKVKTDVIFSSAYGSTELMGSSMILDKTLRIYRGEITAPSLGVDIRCLDSSGNSVLGDVGELVIGRPTVSIPLGLWGDKDRSIFKRTYFDKFPGTFAISDLAIINPVTRGIMICGRSDDTLKQRGCRFGSSEIYNIVDAFPEVRDSICVSQYNKKKDERAVLFLKMRNGHLFCESLVRRIRVAIARELSKRHVPEVILETADIPHNMNGKKMEILVKKIINNMPCNTETVHNPECLENFFDVPELKEDFE